MRNLLKRHAQGTCVPHVIVDGSDDLVGRITLDDIVHGAFQSGHLGYWVGADHNGRGLPTTAVRDMMAVAFDDLALHRLHAGTLLHNVASQRVLERNGFVRFGGAPKYLKIAGAGRITSCTRC